MTAKVIQGSFLSGRPKLPPPIPARLPPPPIQARTAARPPGPPRPEFGGAAWSSGAGLRGPSAGAADCRLLPGDQVRCSGTAPVGRLRSRPGRLGSPREAAGQYPKPCAARWKPHSGANFADVRVHVGPQAERIGAIAFTVGSDIYFAPGRFQPETVHGQQLLGHELAHVVQQRAGRVPNPLGSGLAVVQDHASEAEADRLGQRAAMPTTRPVPLPIGSPSPTVLDNQHSRQNSVANETSNIGNRAHANVGVSQRKLRAIQRRQSILHR
jgi:Domain of unknown function (DUF4157)